MTDQERKAMEMALERLTMWLEDFPDTAVIEDRWAVEALRQALNVDAIDTSSTYVDENEKREHEPVAWEKSYDIACSLLRHAHDILATTQYPIKRPWVSLTDEDKGELYNLKYADYLSDYIGIVDFILIAGVVESKLKENSG